MVLESLNNLNIKRMVLETPEKAENDLPFDVERDITEEDWMAMKKLLKGYNGSNDWDKLSIEAEEIKILDPNINLGLSKQNWNGIKSLLELYRNRDWGNFAMYATRIKIIDSNTDLRLDKEAWDGLKYSLKIFRSDTGWNIFAQQAMEMKILDPKIELDLNEQAWNGMRKELERKRKINLHSFVEQAMEMKILDPKIDLNLDTKMWDRINQQLNKYRDYEHWWEFTQLATYMKILAAEEVRVTNAGIELIMPKPKAKPTKDIPPMPETKKF